MQSRQVCTKHKNDQGDTGTTKLSFFCVYHGMDKEELQRLAEGNSKKIVVNSIIEKLTGKRAKALPRYRPGRIKRSDMDILENKEAEGRVEDNGPSESSWMLCQPCQPLNNTISFDRKEESGVNLPDCANDLVSAHGKLTR